MAATIPVKEHEQSYLATFAVRRSELPAGGELSKIRDAAIERFAELGFPTTHNEEWKYTNLLPYVKGGFRPAPAVAAGSVAERLSALPFADIGCPRLVFVNGRFAPQVSSAEFGRGVTVRSLRQAIADGAVNGRLAHHASFEKNALVALNTAFFEDGAYVDIANGAVLDRPVHLVFVSAPDGGGAVAYPRNLIVAGRDSQAQIIESYVALSDDAWFTNAVTELVAADGAVIDHYKLQSEGAAALHYGALAVRQGASSTFVSHNVALGGALARNEISVVLAGEGADCALNGLYVTTGRQHVDNYTTLDHAEPHCTSHELYKGILDGNSQGVFHGRIIVRSEAQKTDAIQRNKNLLLSENAVINTKPQLEIYADDVKCTHGATVGQVDADAVFYLRSRGIPLDAARALLTYAFTADVIERMKLESIRSGLGDALFRRLAGTADGNV